MSSSTSLVEDFGVSSSSMDDGNDEAVYHDEMSEAMASEDVQRMAELLAPQMTDLQDLLNDISAEQESDTSAINTSRSIDEEDDDMDDEMRQLAMSEEALREELEFAQDMNDRLSISYTSPSSNDDSQLDLSNTPIVEPPPPPPAAVLPKKAEPDDQKPPEAYTLHDHAEFLHLQSEKVGGWYYCNMTSFLVDGGISSPSHDDLVKEYCLPIPFRKLKRMYAGLMYHGVVLPATRKSKGFITPSKSRTSANASTPSTPALQASVVPTSPSTPLPPTPNHASTRPQTPTTPGSIVPPPPPPPVPIEEPLPVRTIAIRIRPDVLCGAVMDAIHHAFSVLSPSCTTHVLKRQGGHLRGAVYLPEQPLAYVVDMQLCSQKNDDLERRLVVRFYHIQDDPEAMTELGQVLQAKVPASPAPDNNMLTPNNNAMSSLPNRHIKQCCSLIQRLMAARQQGGTKKMDHKQQSSWLGVRDTAFPTKAKMQAAVAKHLESNFKACPSVREENKKANPTIRRLTLPCLSKKDWPLLQASWELTSCVVDELDTRDCTFNTISTLPFGQFPSLPTLDVHYCSQLRRLSRESMISHLLKSAKDLEEYAKTAEYNCAICITLLTPMLKNYGIPSLDLPATSKSLQEYPLDFSPPQVSCPPWGSLVMEALNIIAAKTPTGEISTTKAIEMVYRAFTRQDDEEQAARLGRKNAQIMDRLASMQSHQRALIQNIRDSHVYSDVSRKAATRLLSKAEAAVNSNGDGHPSELLEEVPLLSFRISLGASVSGTCFVTAHHILFATSYIPLVGGLKTTVLDLNSVEFDVDETVASTLMNPFPNTMRVLSSNSKAVLYSFRPSIGPTRLHKFLTVIQGFAGEESNSEYSQVVGNWQLSDDEGMALQDHLGEDQLSV